MTSALPRVGGLSVEICPSAPSTLTQTESLPTRGRLLALQSTMTYRSKIIPATVTDHAAADRSLVPDCPAPARAGGPNAVLPWRRDRVRLAMDLGLSFG